MFGVPSTLRLLDVVYADRPTSRFRAAILPGSVTALPVRRLATARNIAFKQRQAAR